MPKATGSYKSKGASNSSEGKRDSASSRVVFSSVVPPTEAEAQALTACMPSLTGNPLPPPCFFRTDWQAGQYFTAEDDPDRTQFPWIAPNFVYEKDPRCQQPQAVELYARGSGSFARVVRNVLSHEDCASLIASVNAKGYTPALLNMGGGHQQLVPGARDGHRAIVDSTDLTGWIFNVLRPFMPSELENGSRLVELNERCRFLCYTPGQQFPAHCDGCFERPENHPRHGDFSYVTVQVYLHDVPESHGGATAFMLEGKPYHQPEAGSVLLFSQDLMHEGCLVKEGVKYTLRTEAMYALPGAGPSAV